MVKVNKSINLTVAVARRLEDEDNQSAVVEQLLRDHYDMEEAEA